MSSRSLSIIRNYLRYGMERNDFRSGLVRLRHSTKNFPGGNEWPRDVVDVLLVHLVRAEDEAIIVAECDKITDVALCEALSGGIAGIDEDQCATVDAFALRLVEGPLQLVDIQRPAVIFVKVVWNKLSSIKRNLNNREDSKKCIPRMKK
jgi:hypothetical protein